MCVRRRPTTPQPTTPTHTPLDKSPPSVSNQNMFSDLTAAATSPRRRRRILRAHMLRHNGATLRDIAEELNVAPSTVHADLRYLEDHWSAIQKQAVDDALLGQLLTLQRDIEFISWGVFQSGDRDECNKRLAQLLPLRRELRLTAAQLDKLNVARRPGQPADFLPRHVADHDPYDEPDPQQLEELNRLRELDREQLAREDDALELDRTEPNAMEQDRTESNDAEQTRAEPNTAEQDRTPPNPDEPPDFGPATDLAASPIAVPYDPDTLDAPTTTPEPHAPDPESGQRDLEINALHAEPEPAYPEENAPHPEEDIQTSDFAPAHPESDQPDPESTYSHPDSDQPNIEPDALHTESTSPNAAADDQAPDLNSTHPESDDPYIEPPMTDAEFLESLQLPDDLHNQLADHLALKAELDPEPPAKEPPLDKLVNLPDDLRAKILAHHGLRLHPDAPLDFHAPRPPP